MDTSLLCRAATPIKDLHQRLATRSFYNERRSSMPCNTFLIYVSGVVGEVHYPSLWPHSCEKQTINKRTHVTEHIHPQRKCIISSSKKKKERERAKKKITLQFKCVHLKRPLKTSRRHAAQPNSRLWKRMINNKRSLTSLQGDIILRTDIALWDRVYNNTITAITRLPRLPPGLLPLTALDWISCRVHWSERCTQRSTALTITQKDISQCRP